MTVYFAEEIGTGRIKIGYTAGDNPQRDRIDGAMTMSSHEVEVRAVLPGADETIEKELHEAFAASRVTRRDGRGTEFFHPGPALWSLIGFVAETKALPCEAGECSTIKWAPAGKTTPVSFGTQKTTEQIPGVTYKGTKIAKTSANVLAVMSAHPTWSGAIRLRDYDYLICTRSNGILKYGEFVGDVAIAKIVNWFVNEFALQIPKSWVKDAIQISSQGNRWNSVEDWEASIVGKCFNSPNGVHTINTHNLKIDGLDELLSSGSKRLSFKREHQKPLVHFRLRYDQIIERSMVPGKRPACDYGSAEYNDECRARRRIATLRNWDYYSSGSVYPTVNHLLDFVNESACDIPNLTAQTVYKFYCLWCGSKGYEPLNGREFSDSGKQIPVLMPMVFSCQFSGAA